MWNGALGERVRGLGASLNTSYHHAELTAKFRRRAVTLLALGQALGRRFRAPAGVAACC